MINNNKNSEDLIGLYKKSKKVLDLPPQYLKAFEYRYGLFDGRLYTYKEIGAQLGISTARSGQLLAKIEYKLKVIQN